jgi:putative polyhydroxyalkanoate system protein
LADIHISRPHTLGFSVAQKIAAQWAQEAQSRFGLVCAYAKGPLCDVVSFSRPGVQGTLMVNENLFELTVQLGFLLRAYKDRIESQMVRNVDDLLRPPSPFLPLD